MDPEMIMTIVVSLIILGVGVFAFFVVTTQISANVGGYSNDTQVIHSSINNTSNTGNSVFNIVGVVLIIGAIMTIVGLVYSYVRPGGY